MIFIVNTDYLTKRFVLNETGMIKVTPQKGLKRLFVVFVIFYDGMVAIQMRLAPKDTKEIRGIM